MWVEFVVVSRSCLDCLQSVSFSLIFYRDDTRKERGGQGRRTARRIGTRQDDSAIFLSRSL